MTSTPLTLSSSESFMSSHSTHLVSACSNSLPMKVRVFPVATSIDAPPESTGSNKSHPGTICLQDRDQSSLAANPAA